MAIRLSRSFINTVTPGAYFEQVVRSTPVGIGATGVVAIIGEAEGGESFVTEALKDNFFSPDQLARVKEKYISGRIVDAFAALSAPSADPNIQGSVNRIYILKTNTGTKSSAVVDTNYGELIASNFGKDGNKIKYKIVSTQDEITPRAVSNVITFPTPASISFTVRVNGGAATVVNLTGPFATAAALVTALNAALPTGVTASAGTLTGTIVIAINNDTGAFRKGWGKALQLIDSTPGDLATIGLGTGGLFVSGAEPEIELNVVRSDINVDETLSAKAQVALTVGYNGTTATLSISTAGVLTTTVSGGPGANLNINLSEYKTCADLASFINSQPGYSAQATTFGAQFDPSKLDKVSGIGICATGASLRPGRIKKALENFKQAVDVSSLVDFEAEDDEGLPSPLSTFTFLSGGTKGGTTGANIVDALIKLEGVAVNFVVPLFSRNASADIADGLTESSSTYTIDAINASCKSHVLKMSTPKLKRHRVAILSHKGTFLDAQAKAASLASFRTYLCFQDVDQVDSQGEVQTYQPWYTACIAAGMQAAGFYRSFTNKLANVISYKDPSGFDSGSPGDIETALLAGLLVLQAANAGVKWVSDQSTYGVDSNFVYNSLQAVYAADVLALDLADSLQTQFVGQSLADVSRADILSFISAKMQIYRLVKLIASSDDAPLGYKNEDVKINGPIIDVKVEIKLATTIFFIPITLEISQVQQTA